MGSVPQIDLKQNILQLSRYRSKVFISQPLSGPDIEDMPGSPCRPQIRYDPTHGP